MSYDIPLAYDLMKFMDCLEHTTKMECFQNYKSVKPYFAIKLWQEKLITRPMAILKDSQVSFYVYKSSKRLAEKTKKKKKKEKDKP